MLARTEILVVQSDTRRGRGIGHSLGKNDAKIDVRIGHNGSEFGGIHENIRQYSVGTEARIRRRSSSGGNSTSPFSVNLFGKEFRTFAVTEILVTRAAPVVKVPA